MKSDKLFAIIVLFMTATGISQNIELIDNIAYVDGTKYIKLEKINRKKILIRNVDSDEKLVEITFFRVYNSREKRHLKIPSIYYYGINESMRFENHIKNKLDLVKFLYRNKIIFLTGKPNENKVFNHLDNIEKMKTKNISSWRVVNDNVMGGLSSSTLTEKENSVLFKGTTSLENNGGFASIRTLIEKGSLKDCKTMSIRYKSSSTNRTFGVSFKTSQRYYIPYHKFTFTPKTNDWEELTVNIEDFKHYKISKIIGNNMPLNLLEEVFNIALIVSDKKEGDFDIEIDYIKFN